MHAASALQTAQQARRTEIFDIITALENSRLSPCSPEYNVFAQSLILASENVEDIVRLNEGDVVCSAIYTTAPYENAGVDPAADSHLYRYGNGMTMQRGVRLNSVPQRNFTIVARGAIGVVSHGIAYPATIGTPYTALTVVNINRGTGVTWELAGRPTGLTAEQLVDGPMIWRGPWWRPELLRNVCTADGVSCFVLCTSLPGFVAGNIYPLAFFALAGALFGAVAAMRIMIRIRGRRSIEGRLQDSLRRGGMFLHYQPIVDATTGALVAAEALMRWEPTPGERVPPDVFIPAAERSGSIHQITRLAVQTAMRDLADTLRRHPHFIVSINIVTDDLVDARFHATLTRDVIGAGIPPNQVAFELTERREIELGPATEAIKAMRKVGFLIYIDDFGTGYSSMSYLSDLTIDMIKIDRSFIDTIGTDAARGRLVGPMMEMIQEIGTPMIVEGVENEAQLDFCRDHGATRIQGWLVGRPMPAAELSARLDDGFAQYPAAWRSADVTGAAG